MKKIDKSNQSFIFIYGKNEEKVRKNIEFFIGLIKEIVKLAKNYMNSVNESPFGYSEIQSASMIIPALSKICNGNILLEMPTKRQKKIRNRNKKISGRIDFWCYHNKYSYLIELKHAWICTEGKDNGIRKRHFDLWDEMTAQLRSTYSEAKTQTRLLECKGTYRVGIIVVPFYQKKSKNYKYSSAKKKNLNIFQNYEENFGRKIDFLGLWEIPKKLIEKISRKSENETYNSVMFLIKIYSSV